MKKISGNFRTFISIFILTLGISNCAPRGENQSVEQVFKNQKAHFQAQANQSGIKPEIAGSLSSISESLDKLTSVSDPKALAESAVTVSETLSALLLKSSYTSRPAITELMNQYRVISHSSDVANTASVKLLAARTYSALAAELETTKFNL